GFRVFYRALPTPFLLVLEDEDRKSARFGLVAENVPPAWAAAAPIKRSAFPASGMKHLRKERVMLRFLRNFVGNSSCRSKPARRVRLEVECLEERAVPAAGITHAGYDITIQATDSGDKVVISQSDNGTPNNPFDDSVTVQWTRGDTGAVQTQVFKVYVYVVQGDKLQQVLNVNQINFYGGNGADKVWNNTNISSKLLGYSGNDELHGGSAHDEIQGGLGSDKIYGGAGYNYLWANGPSQGGSDPSAIDYVYGEQGADDIYGGYKQFNFLFGGDGNVMDHLHGGDASTNYLFGGDGNDV